MDAGPATGPDAPPPNRPTGGALTARIIAGVLSVFLLGLLADPLPGAAADGPRVSAAGEGRPAPEKATVRLNTDRDHYAVGGTVVVYVSNHLEAAITALDQRSFCTIVTLERSLEDDGWQEVRNCVSGAPPAEVTLEPGSTTEIRMDPGLDPLGGLRPGTYRAVLTYSIGRRFSPTPQDAHVAMSSPFHVEQRGN